MQVIDREDVTPEVLEAAEDICCSWYADDRIDWEDFIDRLERELSADFGDSMLSPAISQIRRHIRAHRQEH